MNNIIVLKCGGSTIDELSEQFFSTMHSLKNNGFKPVIVHGGGPAIEQMLEKLQIESTFIDGLRVTTEPMIDVVEMVLSGNVNNMITRKFNEAGITAIGLSGSDAQLITAEAKDYDRYGYVGEVNGVNAEFINQLLDQDIVPVIAPIAVGIDQMKYNVNADTVAGAVAKALCAKQLVFITDVPGVMKQGVLIESATEVEIEQFIEEGIIYGGMIPKVRAAIDSLSSELQEVVISNGNQTFAEGKQGLVGTIVKKTLGVV